MWTEQKVTNLIFDVGNVLLNFAPRDYLQERLPAGEDLDFYHRIIFASPVWTDLDLGTKTQAEAIEELCKAYPKNRTVITDLLSNWFPILTPIKENVQLLHDLKERGYQLYLLSNFHREAFSWAAGKYSFLREVAGKIVSGYHGCIKPDPQIYQLVLQEYSLEPKECLFIDDTPVNLPPAERLGINTILYQNPLQLTKDLEKYIDIRSRS